jgi:ABC-type sugar transport system ATPase subunit
VRDNIAFGLEAQGLPRAERIRRLDDVVRRLTLENLLERRGSALNMSEMQRVAIARVVVTEPLLLLLDEPMSNLDSSTRSALRGELRRMQRSLAQSVLYVTHDQVEAMSMSDRIAVMRDGRIEQIGTPQEIYNRPATRFVAEFIGEPPINFLPCTVSKSGSRVAVETALHRSPEIAVEGDGGNGLIGLRPQAFYASQHELPGTAETTIRFVEFLGSDSVLHVDYGDQLAAIVARPDAGQPGQRIWIGVDWENACLIKPGLEQTHYAGGA